MEQILLKVENLNIEFHDHDVPERVVNQLNMVLHQGRNSRNCRRIRFGKIHDRDGDCRTVEAS